MTYPRRFLLVCLLVAIQPLLPTLVAADSTTAAQPSPIEGITLRQIKANGISMRIAEAGESGPVVLLAHGWPESWYSWRHQIKALAAAGYRVIAPDMRGYGSTDAPANIDDYHIKHITADMVGILDTLGIERATMVGHDWGSIVASHTVLFYPERFNALVIMSVPYRGRSQVDPLTAMREQAGDNFYYIVYHNEAGGVAEKEYDADPRGLLSRLYLSPDSPRHAPVVTDPKRAAGGWIPRLGAPRGLPAWLEPRDLDYIVAEFERAGFRGGVNYYRNFQRNWQLMGAVEDLTIQLPTLFLAGAQDVVIGGADAASLEAAMAPLLPQLRDITLLPGIGHWIQQEAPEATNAALLAFLESL